MVVVPRLRGRRGWMNDRLHVLLVDRRPLFLAALTELISRACPQASIESTTRSDQAIQTVKDHDIDLLFCEAEAVPLGGAEVAARVNALKKGTRVVLLGDVEDQESLVASLDCGAAGFFTKDAWPEEFLEGVDAVLAGHYVVGRGLMPLTLARLGGRGQANQGTQLARLSQAERSVLVMVGQAQSTRAIAASRGISQKTVRNHLASIYRKLELSNRSEAIVWWARTGLATELEDRPERP